MPVEIKICGLKTVEAVTAACDAGADHVGFVFFSKSPRNVTPGAAHDLAEIARGRATIVALTVDATDAALDAIVQSIAPGILQLHGHETPERCREIKDRFGVPIMKVIGVTTMADLAAIAAYQGAADRILLDAKPPAGSDLPGGNGVAFDWSLIAGLGLRQSFMLSGGLTAANVAEAIRITAATAVDVSSGVESAPGEKSIPLIRKFIAAVRPGTA